MSRLRSLPVVVAVVASTFSHALGQASEDSRPLLPASTPQDPWDQVQSPADYFAWALPLAREENALYGVPVSVSLGQSALESGYGTSTLAAIYRNYFGLKCHWKGSRATGCTPTYSIYASPLDCFLDHGQGLRTSTHYQEAWNCPQPVPGCYEPKCFITKVAEGGYAGDPNYAAKVIKIMDDNNLYQYDECGCPPWQPGPGCGVGQRCIRSDGSWDLRPPGGGEYWLHGGLLYQYKRAFGCLCWPTSDWQPGWSSRRGADSWYMRFQGGSIVEISGHKHGCWVGRTTPVCDGIFDVWAGLGNMHSWLGAPIANFKDTGGYAYPVHRPLGEWENKFEGGYITRLAPDKPYRPYPYLWYVEGTPTLWWNDLGTRRMFRRWEPFVEWMAARDLPVPPVPLLEVSGTAITRQELNTKPVGRAMPPLIKSNTKATVHYLDFTPSGPRRHPIPNQTVFGNWGFQWWEVSWRPQAEVDKYPLASSLPDYPPEVRSVSAPRTVPLGQAIVVKWQLKGFSGGPVDKTGVSYRVVGGANKGVVGKKTSTGWRARIPTRGLASGTVIRWYVYARGDGLTAEWPQVWDGEPWRRTTVGSGAGTVPTLKWAGLSGYRTDGVQPNRGTANQTRFVFKVKYTDGDRDAPRFVRLRIRRNGALYRVLGMHAVSGTPATGQVFYRGTTLPRGTYAYRFVAEDDDGRAYLPAGGWKAGPGVTTTTATSVASLAITSVACVPTKAGGVQVNVRLSAPADVAAEVLNIAGRPVRALCRDQACVAGPNVLLWNGRSDYGTQPPPGMYLIRITAVNSDGQRVQHLAAVSLRAGR